MEVLEEADELVFLYHLVDGKSDTSHACHIAASVGLPKEIVRRGAEVCEHVHACVCACVYVYMIKCVCM